MPTLSINNINKLAPKWFRRTKKSILGLSIAANAIIASYGFSDQLMTTRWQLWCTIGIGAVLEAIEALLKDDEQEVDNPAKPSE